MDAKTHLLSEIDCGAAVTVRVTKGKGLDMRYYDQRARTLRSITLTSWLLQLMRLASAKPIGWVP
jgi:hypothetical protein